MKRKFAIVISITFFLVGCKKEVTYPSPSNTNPTVNPSKPPTPYHPSEPYAAIEYNGNLIVGGYGFIAQYNGTSWSPFAYVGSTNVNSLIVYNGNLIAGGSFDSIGGVKANNIAQWNGSNWSTLGSGTGGEVVSLVIYNGNLVAGGGFNTAGGISANNIAQWNGSAWSPLSGGVSQANAMTVFNSKLVVADNQSSNIVQWNGINWDTIGAGPVGNLGVYDGKLIKVGAPTLEQWDGTTWTTFNAVINGYGTDGFTLYNGNLVVAGECAPYGPAGGTYGIIYQLNGSSTVQIGESGIGGNSPFTESGFNGFTIYNGNLIAYGIFTYVNSVNALYIASYNGSTWTGL